MKFRQLSELEAKGMVLSSRRLARDTIEEKNGGAKVLTHPWWDMPEETNNALDALLANDRSFDFPYTHPVIA